VSGQTIILTPDAPNARKLAHRVIDGLAQDKRWQIQVAPWHPKRSDSQNRRLWLLHTKAGEVVGCSAEEMHEEMLCQIFGYSEVKIGRMTRRIPLRRSSTRNTKEFAEFMEKVEAFYIAELGVWIE
jgi:hypothetical protein